MTGSHVQTGKIGNVLYDNVILSRIDEQTNLLINSSSHLGKTTQTVFGTDSAQQEFTKTTPQRKTSDIFSMFSFSKSAASPGAKLIYYLPVCCTEVNVHLHLHYFLDNYLLFKSDSQTTMLMRMPNAHVSSVINPSTHSVTAHWSELLPGDSN